jgi:hypothetical protein
MICKVAMAIWEREHPWTKYLGGWC